MADKLASLRATRRGAHRTAPAGGRHRWPCGQCRRHGDPHRGTTALGIRPDRVGRAHRRESLVLDPLRDNYRAHYAQAFTIPSGAMMDTLLPDDYILVDKSVYRTREPQRGDVVLFRADTSCRYAHGCDLTTVPPDSYFVMGDNRDN